jgi:hypothetical protein
MPKHCPDAVWGTFCKKASNSEKPLFEVKNLPIISRFHCPVNEKAICYYADTTIFKCVVAGALVELSAEYVKFFRKIIEYFRVVCYV